jgi:hypothetical protein
VRQKQSATRRHDTKPEAIGCADVLAYAKVQVDAI